jgi:hypothetical protein
MVQHMWCYSWWLLVCSCLLRFHPCLFFLFSICFYLFIPATIKVFYLCIVPVIVDVLSIRIKLALTSPTSGGRPAGIVCSRTQSTGRERERELMYYFLVFYSQFSFVMGVSPVLPETNYYYMYYHCYCYPVIIVVFLMYGCVVCLHLYSPWLHCGVVVIVSGVGFCLLFWSLHRYIVSE